MKKLATGSLGAPPLRGRCQADRNREGNRPAEVRKRVGLQHPARGPDRSSPVLSASILCPHVLDPRVCAGSVNFKPSARSG